MIGDEPLQLTPTLSVEEQVPLQSVIVTVVPLEHFAEQLARIAKFPPVTFFNCSLVRCSISWRFFRLIFFMSIQI